MRCKPQNPFRVASISVSQRRAMARTSGLYATGSTRLLARLAAHGLILLSSNRWQPLQKTLLEITRLCQACSKVQVVGRQLRQAGVSLTSAKIAEMFHHGICSHAHSIWKSCPGVAYHLHTGAPSCLNFIQFHFQNANAGLMVLMLTQSSFI